MSFTRFSQVGMLLGLLVCFTIEDLWGISIETHNNPVSVGAIAIDGSRAEWSSIPSYEEDGDSVPSGPELDFAGAQMAHDRNNLYVRLLMNDSPSGAPQPFGGMHNLFIDTDQDRTTGFIGGGGFLPTGADILVQGPSIYRFIGETPETWNWGFMEGLPFNDVPTTDIEFSIPFRLLGASGPEVDFYFNAANSNFTTEDFYPQFAPGAFGDFFSYRLTVNIDLNGDGAVDAADAALMFANWGQGGAGDLNVDGVVDAADAGLLFSAWTGDTAPAQSVPEPHVVLFGTAGLLMLFGRRCGPAVAARS